jgi:uncharacterized membrane protein YkgB
MAIHGIQLLRVSLGIVFLWFGALKFLPGISAAEPLATVTMTKLSFGMLQPDVSRVLLALWESVIGLGLLAGRWLRVTLLLMGVQMLGTMTPLILLPSETWRVFPLVPSMEGQYILKNLVLISSALTIGATIGGGMRPPAAPPQEEDAELTAIAAARGQERWLRRHQRAR